MRNMFVPGSAKDKLLCASAACGEFVPKVGALLRFVGLVAASVCLLCNAVNGGDAWLGVS